MLARAPASICWRRLRRPRPPRATCRCSVSIRSKNQNMTACSGAVQAGRCKSDIESRALQAGGAPAAGWGARQLGQQQASADHGRSKSSKQRKGESAGNPLRPQALGAARTLQPQAGKAPHLWAAAGGAQRGADGHGVASHEAPGLEHPQLRALHAAAEHAACAVCVLGSGSVRSDSGGHWKSSRLQRCLLHACSSWRSAYNRGSCLFRPAAHTAPMRRTFPPAGGLAQRALSVALHHFVLNVVAGPEAGGEGEGGGDR